ncbi:MAG: hypothetical protein ACI9QQ_001376 [Myxococcota bacterium]|jgi:hypothetical protein
MQLKPIDPTCPITPGFSLAFSKCAASEPRDPFVLANDSRMRGQAEALCELHR